MLGNVLVIQWHLIALRIKYKFLNIRLCPSWPGPHLALQPHFLMLLHFLSFNSQPLFCRHTKLLAAPEYGILPFLYLHIYFFLETILTLLARFYKIIESGSEFPFLRPVPLYSLAGFLDLPRDPPVSYSHIISSTLYFQLKLNIHFLASEWEVLLA